MVTIRLNHPAAKSVLAILTIFALLLIWPSIALRLNAVVLDIPKPAGSQANSVFKRYAESLGWEEQILIPESTFENSDEVQKYYARELSNLGWIPFDEDHYNYRSNMPFLCGEFADLTEEQQHQHSLELYATEYELVYAEPGTPIFACLYVNSSIINGHYVVTLITIRPSSWAEFNS